MVLFLLVPTARASEVDVTEIETVAGEEDALAGAIEFNGRLYRRFDEYKTWSEAKAFCESLGGHLVTITDPQEQLFVEGLIGSNARNVYFIGGTDRGTEGEWTWVTGEPWEYTNWKSGEPDNWHGESHCLAIHSLAVMDNSWVSGAANKWGDFTDIGYITGDLSGYWQNEDHFGFICEWEPLCRSDAGTFAAHEWSIDGTVISPSDCGFEGTAKFPCLRCGETKTAKLPALEHRYGEITVLSGSPLIPPIVKERTCTHCGDVTTITDWSYVWVPILAIVALVGVVIGVLNYIKAFKRY